MKTTIITILKYWGIIFLIFGLGFAFATFLYGFCIIPIDYNLFGFKYLIPFPSCSQDKIYYCDEYDFKINEPTGGYILNNGEVRINGTVKKLPPYGSVWLMAIVDSNPVSYWPQSIVAVDPTSKTWNGSIFAQDNITAAVVILSDDGRALFEYSRRVIENAASNNAPYTYLFQLTRDVQTCRTVIVRQP